MAAINRYNFLRWYDAVGDIEENILLFNEFDSWEIGPYGISEPVGIVMGRGPGAWGTWVNDTNRLRFNFTGYTGGGTTPVPLGNSLASLDKVLILDVAEIDGVTITIYPDISVFPVGRIDITEPGIYTISLPANSEPGNSFLAFMYASTSSIPGHVIFNSFKLTEGAPANSYSIDESENINASYKASKGCMFPLLAPGEYLSFFVNKPNNNANLDLKIINSETFVEITSISIMQKVECEEGNYFYNTFLIPALETGYVRLGLFAGNILKLVSNPLFVPRSGYTEYSSIIKFRHDRNIFEFIYDSIPEFYQIFRLPILEVDFQNDYQIDQYRSTSTNKYRNYFGTVDKFHKFESYYFDDFAHEAAGVLVEHDEIYINSVRYRFKAGYKINTDAVSKISKGEFELWNEKYIDDKQTYPNPL